MSPLEFGPPLRRYAGCGREYRGRTPGTGEIGGCPARLYRRNLAM